MIGREGVPATGTLTAELQRCRHYHHHHVPEGLGVFPVP